jgi:hypothetical protein
VISAEPVELPVGAANHTPKRSAVDFERNFLLHERIVEPPLPPDEHREGILRHRIRQAVLLDLRFDEHAPLVARAAAPGAVEELRMAHARLR